MIVVSVLAVVIVVLVAELVFRILEPALPTHRLWYDTLPAVHLSRMRQRRDEEGGADVVFCGHSAMHCGLDPTLVLEAAGLSHLGGYNASLHRGFHTIIGPWLEWAVIPILRPKVLVVSVSIADLNDNGPLLDTEPELYRSSLLGRAGAIGTVARRLEPVSALFRNHRMLRSPRLLLRAVGHRRRGTQLPDADMRASRVTLGPNGEWLGFRDRGLLTTEGMFNHVAHGVMANYHVGGRQLAIVERSIRRLQELVPQVVIMTVPFSSQMPPVLAHGQADIDESVEIVRALSARLDVPFLHPEPSLVDEIDFADIVHTNKHGAAKFSAAVGEQLGAAIRSTSLV